MLIQKSNLLEKGDKVVLRLATGDEIACEIKSIADNELLVSRAFRLAITHQGAGFVPFSLLIDPNADITINRSQIVAHYALNSDVEKDYMQAATGIQL